MSEHDIHEKFLVLETRQTSINEQLTKITSDHEQRLRWLERTVLIASGVLIVVKFLFEKF